MWQQTPFNYPVNKALGKFSHDAIIIELRFGVLLPLQIPTKKEKFNAGWESETY